MLEDSAVANVGDHHEGDYDDPPVPPLLPGGIQWLWPQCPPWPGWYLLPGNVPPSGRRTTSGSWALFSTRCIAFERAAGIVLVAGMW